MEKFLIFHTRYKDVQIGYFEEENLIELYTIDTIKISKSLLATVNTLFKQFDVSLKDISFLAAHSGPAPYTTLRIILATLNGINYSVGTPLIGINGLEAFLKHLDNNYANAMLLNAFAQDLYYGISTCNSKVPIIGCKNFETLLNEIACDITGPINFFGNGAMLYKDKIKQLFDSRAIMHTDIEIVPIEFLAREALIKWRNKKTEQELFPVYLK